MVAYSFKRQFVEPIREGRKAQTIRAERFLVGHAICAHVLPVTLDFDWNKVAIGASNLAKPHELDRFARADGFENWRDLRSFWADEHETVTRWSGVLICWTDFEGA